MTPAAAPPARQCARMGLDLETKATLRLGLKFGYSYGGAEAHHHLRPIARSWVVTYMRTNPRKSLGRLANREPGSGSNRRCTFMEERGSPREGNARQVSGKGV